MATRRTNPKDASPLEKDHPHDFSPVAGERSNIAPAVPAHVLYKLLGFTFAMVTVPIGSYFLTLSTIFKGNATFAGATAALMANVVLVGYIIVAFHEEEDEGEKGRKKQ